MGKIIQMLISAAAGITMFALSIVMMVGVPVLIVALGVGLYNNWTGDEVPPAQTQQATQRDEARQEFMDGCDDGTITEFCGCVWREITAVVSLEELSRDGLELSVQEAQRKYATQLDYCYEIYANTGAN